MDESGGMEAGAWVRREEGKKGRVLGGEGEIRGSGVEITGRVVDRGR